MRSRLFDERRRRLRLIQATGEEAQKRLQSAAAALNIASVAESTRHDLEYLHGKLIADCRPDSTWRLRVELHGASPIEVGLDRPYLVIGSDPDCDLHLSHELVNPRHLLMIWIDGHLYCCDISNVSSFRNARHRSSVGWWADEGPIEVGPYRLQVLNVSENAPETLPLERSPRLMNEYPLLALQFDGVSQKENVWPINRVLTLIGRSANCKLRLNHKSVELVQACLLRTSFGCWLIDLVKNHSTRVNGHSIPFASLDVGDKVQLGDFHTEVSSVAIPTLLTRSRKEARSTSEMKSRPPNGHDSVGSNLNPPAQILPFSPAEDLATVTDAHGHSSSDPDSHERSTPEREKSQPQVELASLKDQLEQLKQLYNTVAGQLNSNGQSTLQKSVSNHESDAQGPS